LPKLTGDDLKDLGVTSVGHRRQILDAIATLRLEGRPADGPVQLSTRPGNLVPSETAGERRQLTVMFEIDLKSITKGPARGLVEQLFQ
jgi:hypothetical protein